MPPWTFARPGQRPGLLLGLLLAVLLALAACKDVQPGSGVETLQRKQQHDGGPGGN